MDHVKIEKMGGTVGFGGPHLKSKGELTLSDLSAADRQAVENLFKQPTKPAQSTHDVRYHLTRQTPTGLQEAFVLHDDAPEVVKGSVKDVLE